MEEMMECEELYESDDPALAGQAVHSTNCYIKCKDTFD